MRLYKIWCTSVRYDTFDSAVVVAASPKEARHIHPSGNQSQWKGNRGTWTSDPNEVSVKYVGETRLKRPGVILASFNAG
jgi:hypothetical protein